MFKFLLFQVFVFAVTQIFFSNTVWAGKKDFKIFDIKKNLPLTNEEPVYYDYYTSMGQDQGVERGSVLTVYRRVPVMDIYRNQNHDDMLIPVAKIQIIYSERSMSVGRVIKTANREKIPVLEFSKVMAGDRVEFSGIGAQAENHVFDEDKKPDREIASEVQQPSTINTKSVSLTPSTQTSLEVQVKP